MEKFSRFFTGKKITIGGVLLLIASLFLQECGRGSGVTLPAGTVQAGFDYNNVTDQHLFELDSRGKLNQFKDTDTTIITKYRNVYKSADLPIQSINDSIVLLGGHIVYFDLDIKGSIENFQIDAKNGEPNIEIVEVERIVTEQVKVPVVKVVQGEYKDLEKTDSIRTDKYKLDYRINVNGDKIDFVHTVDTFQKPVTKYNNTILVGTELLFSQIAQNQNYTLLADYEWRRGRIALSVGGTFETETEKIGARGRVGFNF